eukprot:g1405.t1
MSKELDLTLSSAQEMSKKVCALPPSYFSDPDSLSDIQKVFDVAKSLLVWYKEHTTKQAALIRAQRSQIEQLTFQVDKLNKITSGATPEEIKAANLLQKVAKGYLGRKQFQQIIDGVLNEDIQMPESL